MLFTSYQFFLFLPVVILLYFVVIPGKWRAGWLLVASLGFIANFNSYYLVPLCISTLVSYGTGRLLDSRAEIEKQENEIVGRKAILVAGILLTAGVLVAFKYMEFLLENVNALLHLWGRPAVSNPFSLILPVGISYYTFQVISYMVDVYRGKIKAEKNIVYYMVYTAYFPKIISGPIERADAFLSQLRDCRTWKLWDWERISGGMTLMVWGYFQKLVIADRLAIFVEEVFQNYRQYGSVELILGITLFFVQLYADFLGYMNIAQGMSRIMGFTLQENFNAPYFATSVREYWSRWHISLSSWLKDYIYIPLGGNRKGELRRVINLMLTFLVSGLWHGAGWNYIIWGGIHGIYQILEHSLQPVVDRVNHRLHTKTESFGYRGMQIVKTWILNLIAMVFFKCATAGMAVAYLKRIFSRWNPWVLFDGSLYTLGLDEKYCKVVFLALLLFFIVDWMKYKTGETLAHWLSEQCIWFRWGFLLLLVVSCVVFGAYGPSYDAGNFIYFQF